MLGNSKLFEIIDELKTGNTVYVTIEHVNIVMTAAVAAGVDIQMSGDMVSGYRISNGNRPKQKQKLVFVIPGTLFPPSKDEVQPFLFDGDAAAAKAEFIRLALAAYESEESYLFEFAGQHWDSFDYVPASGELDEDSVPLFYTLEEWFNDYAHKDEDCSDSGD